MKDLETERWMQGTKTASYYEQNLAEARNWKPKEAVIHPQDMPWEDSPQGKIKHILNERMENVQTVIDLYVQFIPPGSKSGKHRHMAEEALHILEGKGYDLHWDVDFELKDKYYWKVAAEPKRFEWEAGDTVLIPVNTVHQHFNADPDKPARFISAINCLYRRLDVNDLEQIEEAPKG
jgi:quercetin dioxygenase-like cupin family protein